MGTLGCTWELSPEVKKRRYEKWIKTWKSKPRNHKKDTIKRIIEARKFQSKNGLAPETNDLIRRKISQSMIAYRKENGVWNEGRHYRLPNSKSVGRVTHRNGSGKSNRDALSPEKRREYVIGHNVAVLNMADKLRKAGKKVWTCLDPIPDLIVLHRGKVIAIEVTAKKYIPIALEFKHESTGLFDEVRWVNWKGRSRNVCEKH